MAKVICVLYDDPVDGYPTAYARDDLPKIDHYPGGQTLPTPKAVDFHPGALLGSVSGELGLRNSSKSRAIPLWSPPTRMVQTASSKQRTRGTPTS